MGSLVWWEYPSLGSRHTGNKCSFWWRSKQPQTSNSTCNPKHSTTIIKNHTISNTMINYWELSTSRQWWNNKFTRTFLQGEVGWTIVQGYSFKQVSSTWKRKNKLPREINQKRGNKSGAGVAPSSTYELPQRIALCDLQLESPKHWPWGWGYLNTNQRRKQKMQ